MTADKCPTCGDTGVTWRCEISPAGSRESRLRHPRDHRYIAIHPCPRCGRKPADDSPDALRRAVESQLAAVSRFSA